MLCFCRNLLYTLTTSTIDITSTVTCVPSSVSITTTPSPATTTDSTSVAYETNKKYSQINAFELNFFKIIFSTTSEAGLPFIRYI